MVGSPYGGAIDCTIELNTSSLKGKTAIVTGGAKGIGSAYSLALRAAGAYVVVGDVDTTSGKAFAAQDPEHLLFVECNLLKFEDQVRLFKEAAQFSPRGKIDHVVANAGVYREVDQVFLYEEDGPVKPELSTVDVNLNSVLYTSKIAMHYFIKQNGTTPSPSQEDTCLVLVSSGAGIHDCLRMPQYCATKWAVRGLMHGLRRTAHLYGSRVNVISPWAIKTTILSEELSNLLRARGIEFATLEDAGQCLLRLLSDPTVNGRSLFIAARKWAPKTGYLDLDLEDTEENELRKEIQHDQMRFATVEEGLFV
ncbi:uncharacterized protein Z520_11385 [Fonsecaea multimorphosa CBS 102226]|uniref:Uncharacterized protein n=1 Tax=Fonsecaea multimorphosa CBS 102226 TaxID=1442371 RepID=A0A0D2JR45_9EURO|nr:uncharacterized protein Z520_11385 [Fonsecaea multimorphosa CBS 102226]KIX92909.1 hypothetical protein Z520_11385 [Fonsecaea multimorphosa CBS 102226]OAL18159.1 hypothetical protein AYO22_10936 [Fonsecaea multimorphosa]